MCKLPALKTFLFYVESDCPAVSKQIIGEHETQTRKQKQKDPSQHWKILSKMGSFNWSALLFPG